MTFACFLNLRAVRIATKGLGRYRHRSGAQARATQHVGVDVSPDEEIGQNDAGLVFAVLGHRPGWALKAGAGEFSCS